MRPVLFSDVNALVAVLLATPKSARALLCKEVIKRADVSDRYVRHLGRHHPDWGNGTLAAAAASYPSAFGRGFDDTDFCQCFETVIKQLQLRPRAAHL